MIRLQGVRVRFGERAVLDGIDVAVQDRDRMAIVGRNGEGKTTLLRVIVGEQETEAGEVVRSKGQQMGLLRQEHVVSHGVTLWDEAFAALAALRELETRATAMLEEASALPDADPRHLELLHDAETLLERFRLGNGYEAEATCGRVLSGLGFHRDDWVKDCAEFSGGWQMRIALAKLLLERPDILLLDEPTNHLDLETRTWLLHELRTWPGAVVIISHDRDFLDRLVERTIEVAGGQIQEYRGGYSAFLRQRAERLTLLAKAAEERVIERAHIQAFVDRFRYKASKAAQVQARVKQLEKLPPIIVPQLSKLARIQFPEPPPSHDPMLTLRDASKAYGPVRVLTDVNATVWRGRRILLVGPNGAGKSTLLRLLGDEEPADSGVVQPGGGVRRAWFAQDQAAALDPELTVLQTIATSDRLQTERQVRTFLGSFLFTGDAVHKLVGVLSGGEKSRLALARVLLQRANLLLLDEPTNHLDIETKAVLAEALAAYSGTVVFVSHDRRFANDLADAVWEVGGGTVRENNGNLDDFLWARAIEAGLATRRAPGEAAPDAWLLGGLPAVRDEAEAPAVEASEDDWAARKAKKREADRKERRLGEIEAEIATLEAELESLDAAMADVGEDWQELADLASRRDAASGRLDALWDEWAGLEDG